MSLENVEAGASRPGTSREWRPYAACVPPFAILAVILGVVPPDTDTPWHLMAGKWIVSQWSRGRLGLGAYDPFSWTASHRAWYPNAWGFDVIMGGAYDIAGWAGLAILRLGLLALVIGLAWKVTGRLGAGAWARVAAVWLASTLLIPDATLRPQLITFLFVLVVLPFSLDLMERDRGLMGLVALGMLFALWTNLHAASLIGVVIVLGVACGTGVRTGRWRRGAGAVTAAVLGTCCSPFGLRIWTYAVATSSASRAENIKEWRHASLTNARDVISISFVAVVIVVTLAIWRRDRSQIPWELVLPTAAVLIMAIDAVRNETIAVLVALPLLAAVCGDLGRGLGSGPTGTARSPAPWYALAGGLLLALVLSHRSLFPLSPDPRVATPDAWPVAAARALPSGCRLLNEYQDGGYLIYGRPDVPVSQDGRNDLYGRAILDSERTRINDASPVSSLRLFGQDITCVLVRHKRPLARALAATPGWHKLATAAGVEAWSRSS